MGFSLQPNQEGRSQVILKDEPDYIVPLRIAPVSLEEILMKGRWVVVSFSVWSTHDLDAAYRAVNVAKQNGVSFQLGLSPFDYPEENLSWLPIASGSVAHSVNIEVAEQQGKRIVEIKGRTDKSPIWAVIVERQFLS